MAQTTNLPRHFLALPYDIRFLIYEHLFHACSPGKQIYVQAAQSGLAAITEQEIPIHILAVCRQLHIDAGEYLYNNKIFNIVGSRDRCLEQYELLRDVIAKYATDMIHVDCFSNGQHSSTGCISLYSGDAKKAVLDRRDRGVYMTLDELRREVANWRRGQEERARWQRRAVMMSARWWYAGQLASVVLVACLIPLLDYLFDLGPVLDGWFAGIYGRFREWRIHDRRG